MSDDEIRNNILPAVGAAVRAARDHAGIAQDVLAREAGLDRTMVGMIERGETNPSIVTLTKIARVLATTPSRLLDGIA